MNKETRIKKRRDWIKKFLDLDAPDTLLKIQAMNYLLAFNNDSYLRLIFDIAKFGLNKFYTVRLWLFWNEKILRRSSEEIEKILSGETK